MADRESVPTLHQVVLDCTDARSLAEFYRQLLGLVYRPGDEPPAAGQDDERGRDWLVLRTPGWRAPDRVPAGRSPAGGDLAGRTRCRSNCTWT